MRAVAPRIDDLPETTFGSAEQEFQELTVAIAHHEDGSVEIISRWRLTDEEKARIMAGEDLYLLVLSEVQPPVKLCIGAPKLSCECDDQ